MTDEEILAAKAADRPSVNLRGGWSDWWREGLRSALFLAPRWGRLQASPARVAVLLALGLALNILLQRLYIEGAADFYPQTIDGGWLGTLVTLWLCWAVTTQAKNVVEIPAVSSVFALLLAQEIAVSLITGAVFIPLARAGWLAAGHLPYWLAWALWLAPLVWQMLAQLRVLLRFLALNQRVLGFFTGFACSLPFVLHAVFTPTNFWYAHQDANQPAPARFRLTQDVMERQPELRAETLQQLQAQRPGIVDVYALTFAPYADEDVFRRESAMVAEVMRQRFDAAGRTVELVNHRDTALKLPWATPQNLRSAITRVAAVMDRDEDVLFIHLTSHGAADGRLSAGFYPLAVDEVTPADLRQWLDEAGVRFRVVSVSACYSGSWLAPLADENTLVMTAADASHTSYGCGRRSELTFFGRALFDEALRKTHSFEQAHASARTVIEQREVEAGKEDGYSNPQIHVGSAISARLALLEARLALAGGGATPVR